MSSFRKLTLKALKEQKGLFFLVCLNILAGIIVFVFAFVALRPESTAVKIGYGDMGGYRDGAWTEMLMYPILAFILGFLDVFLALRIFERHGGGVAKMFVFVSIILLIWTFITVSRLLGEG